MADSQSDEMDVATSVEGRDVTSHDRKTTVRSMAASGKLIVNEGQSRYLDSTLWKNLSDEFRDPKEMFHASSEDETVEQSKQQVFFTSRSDVDLAVGTRSKKPSIWRHHPQPMHILFLWQIYLENVNPLTKILHKPTMQKQILEASNDLGNISKALEALMFAIYSLTVYSMTDDECQRMIGEERLTLLDRYTFATHQALLRAKYLNTSDIVVLQAYVLFLMVMRSSYDAGTLWVLSGIAVRIGQRLGLHRDGLSLGLPVFETEMRRRLSWLIAVIDGRSAQVAGQGASAITYGWNLELPSNVNDSDLDPEMQEQPVESAGATEMIFCLIRYSAGHYFERARILSVFEGNGEKSSDKAPNFDKDKQIDDLQSLLENKYIRYCDPVIPLHLLAASMARSAIYSMRVMARHPRQQPDGGIHMSQGEKDELFNNCLKLIEYANLAYSLESMRRYLWHIGTHFQWHAFIYILGELQYRIAGEQVDQAWRQVEEVFKHHPEMITDRKGNFHAAVGRLTKRAWERREMEPERRQANLTHFVRPDFINKLHSQKTADAGTNLQKGVVTGSQEKKSDEHQPENDMAHDESTASTNTLNNDSGGFDLPFLSDSTSMNLTPIDWAVWDDVIKDFELQQEDAIGDEIFS
ncbi:hypothetical protein MMC17_001169 [Xylographa soralifera]|nr:hypothetical protein [Xylographa soralifera]